MKCAIDLRTLAADGVERDAVGAAPKAFRIWKAGENQTDKGLTVFTEDSAKALIAEQAARQNLFSIDVDHLSLSESAPPEARKAVGWHRLEVRRDKRGEPELWATSVEWTDVAKVGLEKDPPEWRYFSPAYDVNTKTREVTAYLNTALTNNPATWGVTALASSRAGGAQMAEGKMSKEDVLAALAAMANGDEEDIKKCAKAALAAFGSPGEKPAPEGEEPPAEKKEGDEPAADAEEEPTEKDAADKADKKDTTPAADTVDKDPVLALARRVQALEAERAHEKEKTERASLLASRPDFAPEVRRVLEGAGIETLRTACKTFPRGPVKRAAAADTVTATRGAGQGGNDDTQRDGYTLAELDHQMGIKPRVDGVKNEGTRLTLGVMTPDQAKAVLATRSKGGN